MLDQACQPLPVPSVGPHRWWVVAPLAFAPGLPSDGVSAALKPAANPADAVVASEPVTVPRDTPQRPVRESAQLQLYGGAGVVMRRIGPSPVAASVTRGGGRVGGRVNEVGGTHNRAGYKARTSPATTRAVGLAPQVDAAARRHDIDPLLLHAVAHVESRHNGHALSSAGARGVMQVMPATAARFGVQQASALYDTATNLDVSAAYLKNLQARFGTNLPLVLAAYNAGEGAVERHGRRIPPYAETQSYVQQVLAKYRLLTDAAQQAQPQPNPNPNRDRVLQ